MFFLPSAARPDSTSNLFFKKIYYFFPLYPVMMRARLSTGYHRKNLKVGVLKNETPVEEATTFFLNFEMSGPFVEEKFDAIRRTPSMPPNVVHFFLYMV
jgi:hypothetical protein